MDSLCRSLNELIVDIYNSIVKIESNAFKAGRFKDVSITEVHTIDAIGMYEAKSMSSVAKSLRITMGTLTVAVNNLVKKGYVVRRRGQKDRRIVYISLSEKGRRAYEHHAEFHRKMIEGIRSSLSSEEMEVLVKTLKHLDGWFRSFQEEV